MSRCGEQLESFTLTHCWETSALDDGFEAVGFEVVTRICGGLRVSVGTNLNAKILIRARGDDEGGKFFLLQGLRQGQGVTFALAGGDLEHDGSGCDQASARRSGIFWRRRGLWGSRGRFPARRAALAGEWRGGLSWHAWLFHWLQMVLGRFRFGGMIK